MSSSAEKDSQSAAAPLPGGSRAPSDLRGNKDLRALDPLGKMVHRVLPVPTGVAAAAQFDKNRIRWIARLYRASYVLIDNSAKELRVVGLFAQGNPGRSPTPERFLEYGFYWGMDDKPVRCRVLRNERPVPLVPLDVQEADRLIAYVGRRELSGHTLNEGDIVLAELVRFEQHKPFVRIVSVEGKDVNSANDFLDGMEKEHVAENKM